MSRLRSEKMKIFMFLFSDDYTEISSTAVKQYTRPRIKESFCFIDPKRCADRFVSGFAWHPTLSGVFVASYCFTTTNTFVQGNMVHLYFAPIQFHRRLEFAILFQTKKIQLKK